MRESERVERGREGSRRSSSKGRSRARSTNRRSHGYVHNVDQNSVSFFVTNFPEDCSIEDLWKVFARYGRVGDVFIPSKVDKWGKRFAFVKFREVKEVWILSDSLTNVWLGSFKLRVNKSRFERKEDGRKSREGRREAEKEERMVEKEAIGDSYRDGRAFKTALMLPSSSLSKGKETGGEVEALQVEVDGAVLKELEVSYVGRLALDVEVNRIKTTLFMEGLGHISVTDMGRNLVLIFSPKVASRNKLDIARIKISTDFRSSIDESMNIKALGVVYSLRIVEFSNFDLPGYNGDKFEDQERSWVASSIFPGEAVEVHGGHHGELVEEVDSVGSEPHSSPVFSPAHGTRGQVDGDVLLDKGGRSQIPTFLSGSWLHDKGAMEVQKGIGKCSVEDIEVDIGGVEGVKVSEFERVEVCGDMVMETCPVGSNRVKTRFRSFSVPPTRLDGPVINLGFGKELDQELSDSISLIEVRRGVDNNPVMCEAASSKEGSQTLSSRQGRSRSSRGRARSKPKSKQSLVCGSKFLHLVEVVREGDGKQKRKKKKVVAVVTENCEANDDVEEVGSSPVREGPDVMLVSNTGVHSLAKEPVLPELLELQNSTVLNLEDKGFTMVSRIQDQVSDESIKLLEIQKKVGFCYKEADGVVVKVLVNDEQRDSGLGSPEFASIDDVPWFVDSLGAALVVLQFMFVLFC
ncbi:unnamed protein product [Trifolium pratense]|uniref:Uncharacterized protein n=1 Tax=Trifolium pratense TaxID=57577 RepID=A0ACB0KH96_TRIPR|nr:unnamed protein product [Trifolium pratense]